MTTVPVSFDGYRSSPSQQSLVLECSVCADQYGLGFDNQPRSLRCGHTFCTKCLMIIMTSRGVKCPICGLLHSLPSPDVILLPINYAVQDITKTIAKKEQSDIDEQLDLPPCYVCQSYPATKICIDCDPGNHFKFCEKCDNDEHNRPFGPAQRHRRFPIDAGAPIPSNNCICSRHPHIATFYSESLDEFACSVCASEDDWQVRSPHFKLVVEVTKNMRAKAQKLTKHTNDMVKKMTMSKHQLKTIISDLEPASMEVKRNIAKTFSQMIDALQERQKILLADVDYELKHRKESLDKQNKAVISANAKYRDAYESLNSLNIKTDADFLLFYRKVTQQVESLIDNEDKSLLRPVINQDVPFFINKEVERQILTLGAVGGGVTPTDLECAPSNARGTMMELYWQLPDRCGNLTRFQIEYEQVLDDLRRSSGSVDGGDFYIQSEPQLYEVPGNELNAYVDYLCPGYSYRFRIRSANDAGLGMWSDPIVGKCEDFPFTLEYTKRIHRIVIPSSSYYRITVKGARAADGMMHKGGRGAIISAVISLKKGDVLILLCGGMSSRHHYHSGGGGGSFVALGEITKETLLIAAGGGGGTRGADDNDFDGSDANIYSNGFDGLGQYCGKGGVDGGPGECAYDINTSGPSWGNGGAGFMQDSLTAKSFKSGGHGGQNGGFGGGGAVGMYGGGGGGGYSGGGGGRGGGGGGSYVISSAVEVVREVGNEGHGSIYIEKVPPPYPYSGNIHSVSTQLSTQFSSSSGASVSSFNSKMIGSATSVSVLADAYQSPASTGQVMDHPRDSSQVAFLNQSANKETSRFEASPAILDLAIKDKGGVRSQEINASAQPATQNFGSGYVSHTVTATTAVSKTELSSTVPMAAPVEVDPAYTCSDTNKSSRVTELIHHFQPEDHQPPPLYPTLEPGVVSNTSNVLGRCVDHSTSQWVMQQQAQQFMLHPEPQAQVLLSQQDVQYQVPQPGKTKISPPITEYQDSGQQVVLQPGGRMISPPTAMGDGDGRQQLIQQVVLQPGRTISPPITRRVDSNGCDDGQSHILPQQLILQPSALPPIVQFHVGGDGGQEQNVSHRVQRNLILQPDISPPVTQHHVIQSTGEGPIDSASVGVGGYSSSSSLHQMFQPTNDSPPQNWKS